MISKNKILNNNPPYSKPFTIISYIEVVIHKVFIEQFLKLKNFKKKSVI